MSPAALWHTLPHTVRTRMSHLGRCLGAGSVKQVNLGRFGDRPDESVAVAVLRRRVQDEALASLSALEVSEDLSAVASRLGQLVYGKLRFLAPCNPILLRLQLHVLRLQPCVPRRVQPLRRGRGALVFCKHVHRPAPSLPGDARQAPQPELPG